MKKNYFIFSKAGHKKLVVISTISDILLIAQKIVNIQNDDENYFEGNCTELEINRYGHGVYFDSGICQYVDFHIEQVDNLEIK